MKSICISVLAVIAAGALVFSIHAGKQNSNLHRQLQSETKANLARLSELTNIIESDKSSIVELEAKVSKLSVALSRSVGELSEANDKIQAYAFDEQNRKAADRNNFLVSVPQPSFNGKTYLFPKVVSANGETLATNAEFAYITGRRLIFRPANQTAISVDVDKIHPDMLQYLKINPTTAKAKQQQIDSAWASKSQSDQVNAAIGAQASMANIQYQQQMSIEQQKADAASQAADAAQRAAFAAQQQAAADKAKADAALINAQKPPQTIQIIQQTKQTVY